MIAALKQKRSWILSLLLLMALLAAYAIQMSVLTALTYHIAQTERSLSRTTGELKELEVQYVRATSRSDLEALAQEQNFSPIESVTYLKAESGHVARRGE